jgi:hypothetical protein
MNIELEKRVEPSLDSAKLRSELEVHTQSTLDVADAPSKDTLLKLEALSFSEADNMQSDDEFDFDIDSAFDSVDMEGTSPSDDEVVNHVSAGETDPELTLEEGDDALGDEAVADSEKDSLDDAGEDHAQGQNEDVAAGAVAQADVLTADPVAQPAPFGHARSAQEFLDSKLSLNDLVQSHLLGRPQSAPVQSQNGPMQHHPQPQLQGSVVQGQAAVADDRMRTGLGPAAVMLGAKGLSGLSTMLGQGGRAITAAISDFSFTRGERDLAAVIGEAQTSLQDLRTGGLSALEGDSLDTAAKKEMLKQFLESPENKIKFDSLVGKLDRMVGISEKLIAKGVEKNMDGEAVMNRAIDPLHRFVKENEKLLKNLHVGDKSLHEKLEGVVTTLLETLRDLALQIASVFQSAPAESRASGPRMG